MAEDELIADDSTPEPDEDLDAKAESAQTPETFVCGVCGQKFPVERVYDVGGSYVCRECYDKQVLAEPKTAAPTPVASGVTATAAPSAPTPAAEPPALRASIICPHCWHRFAPEEALWIAEHTELAGDVVAGPEAAMRFLPSRFTPRGDALDARGVACQNLACPRCHLTLPRILFEAEPLFVSIIGVPASGKSYFLATMAWELRRLLPRDFAISFSDADPLFNRSLHEYEETLFMQNDPDKLVALRKTELQGELYDQVRIGGQMITLPRPFLFSLRLTETHPGFSHHTPQRIMCLYDNAGEHFQAGADQSSAPVTHHLEQSRVLMFLYDPTQDPRFREKCRPLSNDPQLQSVVRTQRQETILTETALRIRRLTHAPGNQKHNSPLLVILAKSDVWAPLVDADLVGEPLLRNVVASNVRPNHLAAVDVVRIESTSRKLREMLLEFAPQVVAAAEDFSTHVLYMPISALGRAPEADTATGMLGVRPRSLHPRWVSIPVLYILSRWASGLVAGNQYPPKPGTQVHGI